MYIILFKQVTCLMWLNLDLDGLLNFRIIGWMQIVLNRFGTKLLPKFIKVVS